MDDHPLDPTTAVFADFIADFRDLCDRVKRIEEQTRPGGLKKPDICKRYLRCSMSHARKQGPWIWPHFGESDVPGTQAWFWRTCEEWYSMPLETRKAMYFREAAKRRSA